jgi:hypothetical protein
MPVDSFIAGPGDGVHHLFKWYGSGETEFGFPGAPGMVMKVSAASARTLQELVDSAGAVVTGRRQFDNTNGWGGGHPTNVPVFVVVHRARQDWLNAHPRLPSRSCTRASRPPYIRHRRLRATNW